MIHVCLCFTDKNGHYTKFVGTTMASIFESLSEPPPSITIHLLHDDTLTQDNRDKFNYLAGRYGQIVKFYNVEELCAENFAKMAENNPKLLKDNRFTIGTMFRLLIPQILSPDIEKAIYLDVDIIVTMDLKEFWNVDLGDNYLAVIPSNSLARKNHTHFTRYLCIDGFVAPDDYFNAGVLLMNLKLLRGEMETIMNGINFISADPRYEWFDQDVLNYCFTKKILKLPARFNNSVALSRHKGEGVMTQRIYHYVSSGLASFHFNMSDPFNRLWMKCFMKTPWFNTNSVEHLYTSFQKIHDDLISYRLKISAASAEKIRAFFVESKKVESVKKIFSIRDDERIILAKTENSLPQLLDAMKNSRDRCVFFIMQKDFPFDELTKANFVQDRDFFKGWRFLSESNGEPFNTYSLIQSI